MLKPSRIEVIGVKLPLVKPGDDLAKLIVECAESQGIQLLNDDVLAITEKVVSKSMGLLIDVESIKPSKYALRLSKKTGLDPRFIEVVLRGSEEVLAIVPIKELVDKGFVGLLSRWRGRSS